MYLHNLNTCNNFWVKPVDKLWYLQSVLNIWGFFRPWKFEHISIGFLSLLLRDDRILPARAIKFFVQCLNHDAIVVRKVSPAEGFPLGLQLFGLYIMCLWGFAEMKHKNWSGTPPTSHAHVQNSQSKKSLQSWQHWSVTCKSVNCEDVGWAESLVISEFFCIISFADGCFSHLQFVIWREPSKCFACSVAASVRLKTILLFPKKIIKKY